MDCIRTLILFLGLNCGGGLLHSQCYPNNPTRISLFSPFINSNPRVKKKIPTEYFGDSSRKTTRTCNGRGIIHVGNGYYLDIGEEVFAPISGIVHIYTLGSNEIGNNTKTGLWIEGKVITANFQGIQPTVADGQYIYKGQTLGKGFDNYGEAGVYFTIRNAPPQNPTVKRSFLPLSENPQTPCKCNNEPVFPEYFINPEMREIDYNEYNEVTPIGELSVHIEPSGVGQWSFDNGESWHSSGSVIRGMPFMYYKIIFKNEYGYQTPVPMEYKLAIGTSAVKLLAKYIPDYSILPRPKAQLENEEMKSDLIKRIQSLKDSVNSNLTISINTYIKDSLQKNYQSARDYLLDSLNKKYNTLADIQRQQLTISQVFKYLLPIIFLLLVALGIYYIQNRKIKRQKKTLELMQTEQHHRVYNNLGIIAGLVFDYGKELGEEKIADLRNSILAIAKVHSQLYKGGSLETIYLNDLFTDIGKAMISQHNNSRETGLEINCHLKINQVKATKLALIINELFTNSLKHAFNESKSLLKLSVSGYKKENSSEIIIQYRDNGHGYATTPQKNSSINGTGMILCYGLAKEIGAELSFYNDNGACCLIKFKH